MENKPRPIPERFYSFESGKPFERCISCDQYLLDDTHYMIEMCIRRYPGYQAEDTVFDYAMCLDCAMKARNELSTDSMQTIYAHFGQHLQAHLTNPQSAVHPDKCLVNGKKIEELSEYQVYAHCQGKYLTGNVQPYLVSMEALEKVLPLLSKKTRDYLDGFFDKHFSPDPSLFEPTPKLILI